MHTERFRQLRKEALEELLNKKKVSYIWRKIVRDQLRSLEIKDLYDHYDFNYNIDDRAVAIKNDILNGTYKVTTPLIYRFEKKFGVCRHLVIPQPTDALIFQVLVESIAAQIIEGQPSKNAFYSRDKHNLKVPHEEVEYGVPFRTQWKRLQKKIYKFNEDKELLIVTDLSNYYDSISLNELKKVFHSRVNANEVVVDLLFQIIEGISWKPDYLPYSGKGLPTSNIEAIRLLAHSFLFEIDDVIRIKTKNSFARWMDDLTIGVNSRKEAISLISSVSDMLKSRGLALNLSKTAIYNTDEAHYHFQIDENIYLDSIEARENEKQEKSIEKEISTRFRRHFRDQKPKYWDKVAKRYITAFGRIRSKRLLDQLPHIYLNYPSLRMNLLFYLGSLGYSVKAGNRVLIILEELSVFDDLSLYQISNLMTSWQVPVTKTAMEQIKRIDGELMRLSFEQKEPSGFYSLLWFKTKYSSAEELAKFLKKYQNLWQTDSFLRRQATASLSRLLSTGQTGVNSILDQQISSGVSNTVSIANQLKRFSEIDNLDIKLTSYLFPINKQKTYPLSKFLVLCSVLNSPKIRGNDVTIQKISEYVDDPVYRHILKTDYGISFS